MTADSSAREALSPASGCADLDVELAVSDDGFLDGRLRLLQPRHGYRAGVDAVLLAAAVQVVKTRSGRPARVLDAGAGAGAAGLCFAARVEDAEITMLERAPELVKLARRNVIRNEFEAQARVIEADLTAPAASLAAAGLVLESFDHVLANPPYYVEGRGTQAGNDLKARSHAMNAADLDRWARFLASAARPGGSLTLIHRAAALGDLLGALTGRFGGIRLLPVHPRAGEAASRIIVMGTKGSRAPLTLLPGFMLHGADNEFLPATEAILRDGASLMSVMAGKS